MGKDSLSTLERYIYHKDIQEKYDNKIDATTYANQTDDANEIEKDCKNILCIITLLTVNISSADFYLLNGVNIRLIFDLVSARLILDSYDDGC